MHVVSAATPPGGDIRDLAGRVGATPHGAQRPLDGHACRHSEQKDETSATTSGYKAPGACSAKVVGAETFSRPLQQ